MTAEVQVIAHDDEWGVRQGDTEHGEEQFSSPAEAIAHGRAMAERDAVDLVIHGPHGTVREKPGREDTEHGD